MAPEPRLEEKEEPVQNHGGQGCACRGVGKGCCKRLRGTSQAGCVCSKSRQVGTGLTWARGPGRRQGESAGASGAGRVSVSTFRGHPKLGVEGILRGSAEGLSLVRRPRRH